MTSEFIFRRRMTSSVPHVIVFIICVEVGVPLELFPTRDWPRSHRRFVRSFVTYVRQDSSTVPRWSVTLECTPDIVHTAVLSADRRSRNPVTSHVTCAPNTCSLRSSTATDVNTRRHPQQRRLLLATARRRDVIMRVTQYLPMT